MMAIEFKEGNVVRASKVRKRDKEGAKKQWTGWWDDVDESLAVVLNGSEVSGRKTRVTMYMSDEVLAAFRLTGAGWQTRINECLLVWVRSGKVVRERLANQKRL